MLSLVIRNASLVDGTGAPAFAADVGVDGDRIAVVDRVPGRLSASDSPTLDARGLTLTPGFVDVHTHSDLSPFVVPDMTSTVRQGVTTVVTGNCGMSPWPLVGWALALDVAFVEADALPVPQWRSFGDYLAAVDQARPAVNVAALIGHGTIRAQVLGDEQRPATTGELASMRSAAEDAVHDGAVGLSTGLIYVPGMYTSTDEIVEVTRGVAAAGGIYASHIRGESRELFRSADEALEIGRRAGLPVHVSHLKCESSHMWGRAQELVHHVTSAGATGDQYPYTAWNTALESLLPPWAPVGRLSELTGSVAERNRLRTAVEHGEPGFESSIDGVGWENIVVVGTAQAHWQGRSMADIAEEQATTPFDAMVSLLIQAPNTSCIGHAMAQRDVLTILADPAVFVASDGSAADPDGVGGSIPVHPRSYGTFPRALALARDESLLPLEAVVRKMTALPADRFGLRGRGQVTEGGYADLVLLDPLRVQDRAEFTNPHRFADGIVTVVVNGTVAWTAESSSITRAGRALPR